MTDFLKQTTAATVMIGPFVDASDGVTEETALSPSIEISKNAASFTSASDGSTAHDVDGWYTCSLGTSDTNTLGILTLKAHSSSAHLPVWHEYEIVPVNVYDSFFSTDKLQVDVTQIEGSDATDQINAEVLDVMNTDTFSELTSVPSATATITQMVRWIYALARNEIQQTTTTQTLQNDADTGSIATATISDDGTTFTREEWS